MHSSYNNLDEIGMHFYAPVVINGHKIVHMTKRKYKYSYKLDHLAAKEINEMKLKGHNSLVVRTDI